VSEVSGLSLGKTRAVLLPSHGARIISAAFIAAAAAALLLLAPAGAAAPDPAGSQQAAPPQVRVIFSGRIVDGVTGEPVTSFAIQQAVFLPSDPSTPRWGGLTTTSASPRADGRFGQTWLCAPGTRVWLRVLADGYEPATVTPEPLTAPVELFGLEVPLKRGREIAGRVLDHLGKPVGGATVYLAGNQSLRLANRQAQGFRGSQSKTDSDGRFALRGVTSATPGIVVSGGPVHAWAYLLAPTVQEVVIRLPEPASVEVVYDIDGD
jgi:hypothetical protein